MVKRRITTRGVSNLYLIGIVILTLITLRILYDAYKLYFSLGLLFFFVLLFLMEPDLFSSLISSIFKIFQLIYRPFISGYLRWNQGANGEEIVAKYLEKLGKDYLVVHDVKLPNLKGNIDHLVVGKNGVFIIETKTHKGVICCYGDSWSQEKTGRRGSRYEGNMGNPSKQVKGQAVALKKFFERKNGDSLGHWINGVIVFPNKYSILRIKYPTVPILRPQQLVSFIRNKASIREIPSEDIENLKTLFRELKHK